MKRSQKGFTLVELLVVIAIIAVLATVSIVGYNSFIDKANLSNDQTQIAMMNRNLQAASVGKTLNNASDAMEAIRLHGIVGDKLSPYSRNHQYAYDNKTKQFVLLDESDAIIYPTNAVGSDELWVFFRGSKEDYVASAKGYVVTRSLSDADIKVLNEYFAGATIDLGGFVCSYSNTELNVSLVANTGIVTHSSWGFNASQGFVAEATDVYASSVVYKPTAGHIDAEVTAGNYNDVVFNGALRFVGADYTATFTNCIFIAHDTNTILPSNGDYNSITFKNCTFITLRSDGNDENYQVMDSDMHCGVVTFEGCEFNTQRGIALGENCTVIVKDCQFNLPLGDGDNYAFRLYKNNSASLRVENCQFNSYQSIMQVRVTDASLTAPENIVFVNNTYHTVGGEKVVAHAENTNTTIFEYLKTVIK